MGIFTRVIGVLGLLPALLAAGGVDHRSSRMWVFKEQERISRRIVAEMQQKQAAYRATHPEVDLKADLPTRLAAIPEDRLDIGLAALELAHEFLPKLDIAAYSRHIDEMAEEVRKVTQGSTDPEYRIRALNTYFFKLGKIRYNYGDPTAEKIENRYLSGIIDSGVGNCFTMPLLYHAVAQRLGYPIKFVFTPRHSFLRYDDPKLKRQNIEAASYGTYHDDDYYKQWLPMKPEALKNGLYMRTLSNREFLADLIGVNAADWGRASNKRDLNDVDRIRLIWKEINYLHVAEKLDPRNEQVMQELAYSYEFLNYLETKIDSLPIAPILTGQNGAIEREFFAYERQLRSEHLATAQAYYQKVLSLGLEPKYYTKQWKRDYLADIPRLKKNNEIFEKKMAEGEARLNEFMRKIASDRRNL